MAERRDVATATVGLSSVAGAGAARHIGLDQAYGKDKRPKVPFLHEAKLLRRGSKGRPAYLTGAALGAVGAPAAATGISGIMKHPVTRHRQHATGFVHDGVKGAKQALTDRTDTITGSAPPKLVAGNYVGGAAVGSGGAGLVHRALRHSKVPKVGRAAIASAAGVTAGSAALPAQSAVTRHVSHGRYEVTATGVRRKKTKPVRPSSMASVVDARPGHGNPYNVRSEVVPGAFAKRDPLTYPGSRMTPGQKRAAVGAVTGPPIIGDIAQAATAARLAPPSLRKETAARTYGGGQAGGVTGQAAGAYGLAALAHKNPTINRGATALSGKMDQAGAAVRAKIGLKPKPAGPSFLGRQMARAPQAVQRAVKPLARNPKVAALGALAGGAVGGAIGTQLGYGSALHREQDYRARIKASNGPSASHGGKGNFAKMQQPPVESQRKRNELARRKRTSAALSMVGGTTGLAALASLGAGRHPRLLKLKSIQTPLLATGAGVGGANSFLGANIQRREAAQQQTAVHKALVATGIRRAPGMRSGFVRQTRYRNGLTKVVAVRGGLA